jgi:hypothetical protein
MKPLITFADFEPGEVLGEAVAIFNEDMAHGLRRIFGECPADSAAERASVAVIMMMRAYCSVVTPRPPGNIHARQRFSLQGVPQPGEAIRTVVECAGKEIKRNRRYVELRTRGTGDQGRPLFTGDLTLVWSA